MNQKVFKTCSHFIVFGDLMSLGDMAMHGLTDGQIIPEPGICRVVEKFAHCGRNYRVVESSTNGAYPRVSLRHDLEAQTGYAVDLGFIKFFKTYTRVTSEMLANGEVPVAAVQIAFGR